MDLVFCLAGIGFFRLFGTSLCLILIVLFVATDSVVKFVARVKKIYVSQEGLKIRSFSETFVA